MWFVKAAAHLHGVDLACANRGGRCVSQRTGHAVASRQCVVWGARVPRAMVVSGVMWGHAHPGVAPTEGGGHC